LPFGSILFYCNYSSTNCKIAAVALAERSAAFVLFQRHQPSYPLEKNVNSADHSLASAVQLSGNNAKSAIILHFVHIENKSDL